MSEDTRESNVSDVIVAAIGYDNGDWWFTMDGYSIGPFDSADETWAALRKKLTRYESAWKANLDIEVEITKRRAHQGGSFSS